jgi:thioesterase domain-containing protein
VLVDGQSVEYVEASEADVVLARELSPAILARNLDELSPPSRSLLRAMRDLVKDKEGSKRDDERLVFDRQEIQRATGLSLWHVKTYLEQLVAYEYLALVSGRKGKRCLYELLWDGDEPVLM